MHHLLEKIFETGTFTNSKGETVTIHSETSKDQCSFLQSIIRDKRFENSIEIGFAYGISTLAITEEIVRNNGRHLVMDKFQLRSWKGNGLDLIKLAGYTDNVAFYEEFCYIVLPDLLRQGRTFDFAYIDSTKQFDWLLTDFFFLDKMLDIGGIIVFDDVNFPGIRKLLRYIIQFPSYNLYDTFPKNSKLPYKRIADQVSVHSPRSGGVMIEGLQKTDYELGINSSCVAIEKISADDRNWDWHKDF